MNQSPYARITALAADRRVHEAFRWLHLNELRLRQWQLAVSAIAAPTFYEHARAAHLLEHFTQLGLEGVHIDAAGNAVGAAGDSAHPAGTPALLVCAHLDTVFPLSVETMPQEDGDVLRGPGICDNAAGLTALLALAAAMQAGQITPACPVLFAANVGEEGEGDLAGMKHLLAVPPLGRSIGGVIALEGAGAGIVVDRALGSRRFRVTVNGPGGHSWADSSLPNPIFALSAMLAASSNLQLPSSPRTTLHAGTVSGGTSVNSIPQHAEATLDLRSTDAMTLERAAQEFVRTLQNAFAAYEGELMLRVETIGNRPASTVARDSALMATLLAVDRHLAIATEPRIGSTDANWPLHLGIPALAVGCGGRGEGLHTMAETYDTSGRELALRRILLLVLAAAQTLGT